MNPKHNLILFLISKNSDLWDMYNLVKVFDRAAFPAKIGDILQYLLKEQLVFIKETFENGTPNKYSITTKGQAFLNQFLDIKEITKYIKTMDNPEQILEFFQHYILN